MIKIVRFYQKYISPLSPPSCRYYPTCSNYMINAVRIHGTFKGSIMGFFRILRCNPFQKGGYDPVPKEFSIKRNTSESKNYRKSMKLK